jgi:hypothetical protein
MRSVPLVVMLMLAVLLPAGTAHAACFSSTPSTNTFADSPADGDEGLAPEIVAVTAATGAECQVAVGPVLAGYLAPGDLLDGDAVGIYLDTDGNAATGSPLWGGADRVALIIGEIGPDLGPGLGIWNGADFDFVGAPPVAPLGAAGVFATVDQLGIAAPSTVGMQTIATWDGLFDTYADFAPEVFAPSFRFPVAFSTTAPPPPPPPPMVEPPVEQPRGCVVPRVNQMRAAKARRRLRRAGCRYRIVRVRSRRPAGQVISSWPRAGWRTSGTVRIRISRGRARRAVAASTLDLAAVERRLSAVARAQARDVSVRGSR